MPCLASLCNSVLTMSRASALPHFALSPHRQCRSCRLRLELGHDSGAAPRYNRRVSLGQRLSCHAEGNGGDGGSGGSRIVGSGGDDNSEYDGRGWSSLTFLFAALLLGGGAAGYLKRGSKKSIVAASACSSVMVIAAILMRSPATYIAGIRIAIGLTASLAVVMGIRYKKSGKLIPSGLLFASSIGWCLTYLLKARLL